MKPDSETGSRTSWLFRIVLRCCPADFRHEVGSDVTTTHQIRRHEYRQAGLRRRALFLLRETGDLVKTALREWRIRFRGQRRYDVRAEWESVTSIEQLRTPPPPPVTLNSREPEMLKNTVKDLRHAFRSMLRKPGFAIVVILTLAIGIGATTAVFSVLEGVLLRPLPYPEPDRLVVTQSVEGERSWTSITYNDYLQWQEQQVFENVAVFGASMVTVTGQGDPFRITRGIHSHGFFDTLELSPLIGRTFTSEEHLPDGGSPIVIGYGLWQRLYGGNLGSE